MFAEIGRSQTTGFLTSEQCKDDRPLGTRTFAQNAREFQYGGCTGSIVVSPVINTVTIDWSSNPQVIEMCRQQDSRVLQQRITASQNPDCVPSVAILVLRRRRKTYFRTLRHF